MPQVPRDRADVFFFVGNGAPMEDLSDVVTLDCSDAYADLPAKVRSIVRWAQKNGYEFVLKCDDDVVLRPTAFLDSGYEKYEFSGGANRPAMPYTVTFGFCYVLGKRSIDIMSNSPLPGNSFADELWVAQTLWRDQITLTNIGGYSLHTSPQQSGEVQIARCVHLDPPGAYTQEQKLTEFEKIFNSPAWTGVPAVHQLPHNPFPARVYRYGADGCTVNWWDRKR